jgi:hypothetical protein
MWQDTRQLRFVHGTMLAVLSSRTNLPREHLTAEISQVNLVQRRLIQQERAW